MAYQQFYPQYQQQYPQQVAQQSQYPQHIVRPVASIEEARAVQTDFSGALTIMPDLSHGYIYTKQLNLQTGCADFAAYSRVQDAPKVQTDYVPRGEFDELTRRFNALCDQLGGAKNE
jgi:hypothetical protein